MTLPTRTAPGVGIALGVWAVGVQTNELIATVGAWSCAALLLLEFLRQPRVVAIPAKESASRTALRAWWPLVAFLGWALIVPTLAGALPTGTGLARLSDWLLLPVAARAFTLISAEQLRRIQLAAAMTLLVSCLVAGAQHFGFWPPLESFSSLEWTRLAFARVYEAVPGTEGRFMGGGLLFHRLKFANVTSLFTVLALALGLAEKNRTRIVAFAIAALGLVSVAVFPYARAALIACVVGCAVVLLLSIRRRAMALALTSGLLAAVVLVVTLSPGVRERFAAAGTPGGSGERGVLLATGLAAIEAHPIAGLGAGRFRPSLYAEADAPAQVVDHPGKAHNQFVSLAAETGIAGALLFLGLLGWLAAAFWRHRPRTIGPLAALVVFVILALSHDPLFHAEFSLALVFVAGFGASLGRTRL